MDEDARDLVDTDRRRRRRGIDAGSLEHPDAERHAAGARGRETRYER